MNLSICASNAASVAKYVGIGLGVGAVIVAAIAIALAVALKKRAVKKEKQRQGKRGELRVEQALGDTQRGKQYVFNNYSAYRDGRTFEVDHILINPRGIFVLETKNWAGEVYGTEDGEMWKQYHGRGKYAREDSHPNPIKQNSGHARHISKILEDKYVVNPIVVMANDNAGRISSDKVVNLCELKAYLDIFGEPIYSAEEMQAIYEALAEYQKGNGVSHSEHVRTIERNRESVAKGICPLCGGKLTLKHGDGGDFWGCENFPNCKFKTDKK